jgi:hypothetical protein
VAIAFAIKLCVLVKQIMLARHIVQPTDVALRARIMRAREIPAVQAGNISTYGTTHNIKSVIEEGDDFNLRFKERSGTQEFDGTPSLGMKS